MILALLADRLRTAIPSDLFLAYGVALFNNEATEAEPSISEAAIVREKEGGKTVKPYLEDRSTEFSLSHDEAFLGAAFSTNPVGVDIALTGLPSHKSPRAFLNAMTSGMSSNELWCLDKPIMEIARHDKVAAFKLYWTMKESYLKMLGTGLMLPLDAFEIHYLGQDDVEDMTTLESPYDAVEGQGPDDECQTRPETRADERFAPFAPLPFGIRVLDCAPRNVGRITITRGDAGVRFYAALVQLPDTADQCWFTICQKAAPAFIQYQVVTPATLATVLENH